MNKIISFCGTFLQDVACQILLTRNSDDAEKPRDAFKGQSRSPNMVPLDMLCMVSYYCALVTLSLSF